MSVCVFCNPEAIEASIEIMYGSDGSSHYVFEPLHPVTPGHLLVVPAIHVRSASADPFMAAMGAGVAARVALRYPSANLITSIEAPATQSVFHLHWHVVPRQDGDGLKLPWSHHPRE